MGLFITVEGGEFTGKTSVVIPTLVQIMEYLNIPVLASREPGGTPAGEAIRQKIFNRIKEGADSYETAILFNQARKIHLDDVIIPFLGRNKEKNGAVILDRYLDSTRVYQGLEGGVSMEYLIQLENEYAYSYYPDLTLVMYFPEDIFLETFESRRKKTSNDNSREYNILDEGEVKHHLERQRHYMKLKKISEKNCERRAIEYINAAVEPKKVATQIIETALPFIIRTHAISQEKIQMFHSFFLPKLQL